METDRRKPSDGKRGLKSSFAAGIAALVFIVIGYQSALFIHRAAVLGILDRKDVPDTVFVIDKTMAGRILDAVPKEQLVTHEQKLRGKDVYVIRKNAVHEPEVEAVRQRRLRELSRASDSIQIPFLSRILYGSAFQKDRPYP